MYTRRRLGSAPPPRLTSSVRPNMGLVENSWQKEVAMPLQGKHALVTGSSRGIGRGIALKLAEKGVKVAINYYRNEEAAAETLARVRDRGSDGFIVQADVALPEDMRRMFRRVEGEFG